MDGALQLFLNVVAVVVGILSPIIAVLFLALVVYPAKSVGPAMLLKAEELKKKPPFDEVEVNVSPDTNIMTARFIKDDVVIWQGSSSRNRMERDGILEFTEGQ